MSPPTENLAIALRVSNDIAMQYGEVIPWVGDHHGIVLHQGSCPSQRAQANAHHMNPPPVRSCVRGRWRRREQRQSAMNVHIWLNLAGKGDVGGGKRNRKATNVYLRLVLHAREVEEP